MSPVSRDCDMLPLAPGLTGALDTRRPGEYDRRKAAHTGVQATASDCRKHADGYASAECTCGLYPSRRSAPDANGRIPATERARAALAAHNAGERAQVEREAVAAYQAAYQAARAQGADTRDCVDAGVTAREYVLAQWDVDCRQLAADTTARILGATPEQAAVSGYYATRTPVGATRADKLSRGPHGAPSASKARKAATARRAGYGAPDGPSLAARRARAEDSALLNKLSDMATARRAATGRDRRALRDTIRSACRQNGIDARPYLTN